MYIEFYVHRAIYNQINQQVSLDIDFLVRV
jgi:hypothetical protein